jgi:hypothetical protein
LWLALGRQEDRHGVDALIFTTLLQAAAPPDAEVIRRTAEEVLRRPEFQTEIPTDPTPVILLWLLGWLQDAFEFLGHLFTFMWDISPLLAVAVITLLVILIIALLAHIAYSFKLAIQNRANSSRIAPLTTTSLDPRSLEIEAEEAAHRQDYIRAVRLLFRASLVRIEQAAQRKSRPGITNREYLRRYRDTAAYDALKLLVDTIDDKWYGYSTCDQADYLKCLQANDVLRAATGGKLHAHGA